MKRGTVGVEGGSVMAKILIATNHLVRVGGSERHAYALTKALAEAGHQVSVYARQWGPVGDRFLRYARREADLGDATYDAALASHAPVVRGLLAAGVAERVVQTCHGVFPELERPVRGADAYVAVSLEVAWHLEREGIPDRLVSVVLQPVCLETFQPGRGARTEIVSICQGREAHATIAVVAARLGLPLVRLDKFGAEPTWDVERRLGRARVAVAVGRGACEALASGCPVLSYDHRSYARRLEPIGDGLLTTHEEMDGSATANFTGRATGRTWTVDSLYDEIVGRLTPEVGIRSREWAEERLDARRIADRYLALAGITVPPTTGTGPMEAAGSQHGRADTGRSPRRLP